MSKDLLLAQKGPGVDLVGVFRSLASEVSTNVQREWISEGGATFYQAFGIGAGDRIRTGDPHLGKVMLYH